MAILAVLIPLLMLGVVLVLGRYEELLLPQEEADRREPAGVPPAAAVSDERKEFRGWGSDLGTELISAQLESGKSALICSVRRPWWVLSEAQPPIRPVESSGPVLDAEAARGAPGHPAVSRPRGRHRLRAPYVHRASARFGFDRLVRLCGAGRPGVKQARLPGSWSSLRPVIPLEDRACRCVISGPTRP
ncbi:hypothetical protein GCM10010228_08930 [Streptomyces massasporeus]|nr:hypothetical protein GCM10010228_08930 [Streptomyces massasporeus]